MGALLAILCPVMCPLPRDKNFRNFDRFFAEISFFGAGGKEIKVEKSFEKKSWKNREKSPIFRQKIGKIRYFPEKNPILPEIWGKLYFRSLRGEKLKNGPNQSCRIKKKCIFGKNNSCLVH